MSFAKIHDVGMVFSTRAREVAALEGLSFSATEGEFISIIGPSGSGKTTLLRIIGNLLEPTSGRVTIDGMSARQARLDGTFSYVFQNPVLLPWRTVLENVRLPNEILHRQARDPLELLRMVGLEATASQYPSELSGGMQQRVALARALTFDPKILLMDEPFGALDELTRNVLNRELVTTWQEIGVTIFFITHSISEALFLADRVVVLSGRPAKVEHIQEVPFPRPREEAIRETQRFQEIVRCLREKLA